MSRMGFFARSKHLIYKQIYSCTVFNCFRLISDKKYIFINGNIIFTTIHYKIYETFYIIYNTFAHCHGCLVAFLLFSNF